MADVSRIEVRGSTLIGLAVMDMIDAGCSVTIMAHDLPDELLDRLLGQLIERGYDRRDLPDNHDMRGVVGRPVDGRVDVDLWPVR